jgi:hypothetical protein
MRISIFKFFFNSSFFTRVRNKIPLAHLIVPISKSFKYSLEPLLRPFTCHLNPIYIRAIFNAYFNVVVPFSRMSASDVLACLSLTTKVLKMPCWTLLSRVRMSCVDIYIAADGEMLTNTISVKIASNSVSKCLCRRRCETCRLQGRPSYTEVIDVVRNIMFDWTNTGILI